MLGLDVEELGRTAWDGYGIENPVVRNQRVPEVQGYTGAGQGNERVVIPPRRAAETHTSEKNSPEWRRATTRFWGIGRPRAESDTQPASFGT
jgi:hypothetical protein